MEFPFSREGVSKMAQRGARLASLTGALCVGSVVLICTAGVGEAQSISFLAPRTDYEVGERPQLVAVGDFNGDGKLDLAVATEGSFNVSVLLVPGAGTFGPAVNFAVESYP